MSRYIDADKLEKAIRKRVYAVEVEDILAEISNTPTIDLDTDVWCKDCKEYDKEHHNCPRFNRVIRTALEDADMVRVVRCRECRYCKRKHGTFKGEPIIFYRCEEHNRDVENDDYCSYGERSEE